MANKKPWNICDKQQQQTTRSDNSKWLSRRHKRLRRKTIFSYTHKHIWIDAHTKCLFVNNLWYRIALHWYNVDDAIVWFHLFSFYMSDMRYLFCCKWIKYIMIKLQLMMVDLHKIITSNAQTTNARGKNFFFFCFAVKMDTDNNLNYINRQTN